MSESEDFAPSDEPRIDKTFLPWKVLDRIRKELRYRVDGSSALLLGLLKKDHVYAVTGGLYIETTIAALLLQEIPGGKYLDAQDWTGFAWKDPDIHWVDPSQAGGYRLFVWETCGGDEQWHSLGHYRNLKELKARFKAFPQEEANMREVFDKIDRAKGRKA